MRKHVFCVVLIMVFGSVAATTHAAKAIEKDYPLSKIHKRIYVIHGPNGFPNKANQGFMNNPVIVDTDAGLVVIDPGSSVYTGEFVVKKAKEINSKKIVAVFNTHVHGDHWLGNHGIQKHYPEVIIYSHPRMKQLIAQGAGDQWVSTIEKMTEGETAGTKVVGPNKTVVDGDVIEIGTVKFKIHHPGKAHTDNDILVELLNEKVVVCGDNVRDKNVAPIISSVTGNIAIADKILALKADHYVPGHGQTDGAAVVSRFRQFLLQLKASVKKYYAQDLSDFEMKPKVVQDLKAYQSWYGFEDNIGKMVIAAYLEVEAESF